MIPARTRISFNMHCAAYSSQRTDTVKPALGTYQTHPELSSEGLSDSAAVGGGCDWESLPMYYSPIQTPLFQYPCSRHLKCSFSPQFQL